MKSTNRQEKFYKDLIESYKREAQTLSVLLDSKRSELMRVERLLAERLATHEKRRSQIENDISILTNKKTQLEGEIKPRFTELERLRKELNQKDIDLKVIERRYKKLFNDKGTDFRL